MNIMYFYLNTFLVLLQLFRLIVLSHGFESLSVSTSIGLIGGTAVYYMLTQTYRETLGGILAGRRCPVLENGTKDKLLYIDTYKWDGETKTTVSGLLYYFSILVTEFPFTQYKKGENIEFPWGQVDINNDPLEETFKIREYLDSISGGFIRLNITEIDRWNLYPLGIARLISENREKTINIVEEGISNSLNKVKNSIEKSSKGKKNKKCDDKSSEEKNCNNNKLSDMISVPHRRAISSKSPIHVDKNNPKVSYTCPNWAPGGDTSWDELVSIYKYLEPIFKGKKVLSKINVISRNNNLERFSLSFVLFWRERQYDISSIDPVNYSSSSFRKSLGVIERSYATITDVASLAHGKRNGPKVAPWKLIPDSMWKHNPFQSFERVVFSVYSDEIKKVKYNSKGWNVYDYSIGVVFHTFSRDIGLPFIFGQYQEKVSDLKKLYSRNPLMLEKYELGDNGYEKIKKKRPQKRKFTETQQEKQGEVSNGEGTKDSSQFKKGYQENSVNSVNSNELKSTNNEIKNN
ncbi:hypothetical protein FG386_002627 [Cryptosporidium ryanae]|uniref:uncharacterized protein n=1 Tax=Cryptosporidium ryanae TaxID=515981 RepID=UPI003519F56E|nr:hypothetical protein FG386_002627 [Cryptosporidium ryanae]